MEAAGEVLLLHRGRRGVVPTAAGEALAHHARTILHQMAQMRGDLGRYAKGMRATVRILTNTAAMTEFLPQRLAPWMAANPQIDIDLQERQSTDIARSVTTGSAEIGILSSAVETDDLTLKPFAVDRLVAVFAQDHLFAQKPSLRFTDLLGEHFIALTDGALQQHLDMQAARLGAKLKVRVALRNFDGICRMAGAGIGVGIVPERAARRLKRSARIAMVRLQDDWATRKLSVCVRSEAELTVPARSLLVHLAKGIR